MALGISAKAGACDRRPRRGRACAQSDVLGPSIRRMLDKCAEMPAHD